MNSFIVEYVDRIDKLVASELNISRTKVHAMIEKGLVFIDDVLVSGPNVNPKVGQNVTIKEDETTREMSLEPQDIKFEIVFEDNDLMVINKPSGLVVHPGNGIKDGTLVNGLLFYNKNISKIGESERPGIVHRIDKDTEGLMVVAKSEKAMEKLSLMISKHEVERTYIAICEGKFEAISGKIDAPIGRDDKNRIKYRVTNQNSKAAVSHFELLDYNQNYSLVKVNLETGRTHQIRVHMKYINHPIVNDPLYSNKHLSDYAGYGQFLVAKEIKFTHPITNKVMEFSIDYPKEFKKFMKDEKLDPKASKSVK